MTTATKYIAHQPDAQGYIDYSEHENQLWQQLYQRQVTNLPGRACPAYLNGLDALGMSIDRIPQLP